MRCSGQSTVDTMANVKESKVKETQKSTPKKKRSRVKTKTSFYATQILKSALIVLIASAPLNFLDQFIINVSLQMEQISQAEFLVITSRINYLSTITSFTLIAGLFTILFKLNWSYSRYINRLVEKKVDNEQAMKNIEALTKN